MKTALALAAVVLLATVSVLHGADIERNNNDLAMDSGEDSSKPQSRSKYDPSLFDILGSDYFDDDSGSKNKGKDAPPALSPPESEGLPVEPVVVIEEEVVTEKPYCLGCPMEVDIEDDKVKEIAGFALDSHLKSFDALDQGIKMVRVLNAMTQVVAGQKYILDVEVGFMNCTKGEHEQNPQRCLLDPEQETFTCSFEVVEQKWLNSKEVVRSKCNPDKEIEAEIEKNDADTLAAEGDSTDSPAEISDDDEDYLNRETEVELGSDEVERVPTTTSGSVVSRKRRDAKKLGGQQEAKDDKKTLMELASFAVEQLDIIDADTDARMAVEVLKAKKQTVSGWLYDLTIRVAHTTCPEGEPVTMEKCKDKIVAPYRICLVKILFQPWQTVQKKVTESQCYPEKYKKGKKLANEIISNDVVQPKSYKHGGFHDVDVNSKELAVLADFIVDSIDQQSNALHAQKLVKVVQAQRQVVSGIKTKMVVELGYTSCRKNPSVDRSQCEIDEKRDHQFCNVTIWEQAWLKSRQITHSKCGFREAMFKEERKKRSLSLFGVTEYNDADHVEFRSFVKTYGKRYNTEEEYTYRREVFKDNMKKVKLLQENEMGTATYGATMFADLTEEEFTKHYLGLRRDLKQGTNKIKKAKIPLLNTIPAEFDWRNYAAVTPVKNQGMCGSCWAFSVTGNIEGLYARKHGQLVSFSEQELVDCDTLDEGCNGGLPENAYKSIQKLGGLETETAYPYDGRNDNCSFDSGKAKAQVTGFVEMPKNETDMAKWLVKNGPLSIGINANAMQFYFGGVSHPWKFLCGSKSLDHGVLIVGYGVHTTSIRHKTLPYWIVKNSWGTSWGEKGYYRVYRGDNTCGVAEMATSAVVE